MASAAGRKIAAAIPDTPAGTRNGAPLLRNALDWLRDQLAPLFESKGKEFFKDPWLARDEYISVILDRSPENIVKFFTTQATHESERNGTNHRPAPA